MKYTYALRELRIQHTSKRASLYEISLEIAMASTFLLACLPG
ncbi:MAG: hypothetical protein AAF824_26070 [Bacteroidota bacterium]